MEFKAEPRKKVQKNDYFSVICNHFREFVSKFIGIFCLWQYMYHADSPLLHSAVPVGLFRFSPTCDKLQLQWDSLKILNTTNTYISSNKLATFLVSFQSLVSASCCSVK